MLEPAMDLEADLGIDSIKRVEILSSVQEKVPGLPELDNDRLSALRTLAEVVDYLAETAGASSSAAVPTAPAPAASPVSTGASGGALAGIQAAMFESVAEKTGYPLDMLEPAMDLEADLGIDSIKRVEILSAVQDKVPGLPELDNDRLSALRTLDEVVQYLAETAGGAGSASVSTPALVSLQPGSSQVETPPVALLRKEVRLVPCGPGIPAVPAGRIAVTSDDRGHVDTLVKALVARGVDAVRLDVDWGALAEGRFAVPDVAGIVHFACVGARGTTLDERVKGAFLLAKAVGPVPFFATVSTMGGDFGLAHCKEPVMGGLAGLPKTLSHEWDGRFLALDLDASLSDTVLDRLADALVTDFASIEIGVQESGLFRLHNAVVSMPWNEPTVPVQPGELVVVSGGAKGVTASVVVEIAKRYRPHLLLLGRSELDAADPAWAQGVSDDGLRQAWMAFARSQGEKPTPKAMDRAVRKVTSAREIRATLEAVRATGSEVQYAACDIRDADSVEAAVAQVGKPVAGIVHGAGVLADKLVVDKTPDQFDFVWGTKVEGLDALLSTTDKHLKLAVLFSSVAGRYGNIGQVDYSMANEVLTHTGLQLAQRGVRVKSFDWGPWEAGMVTPALKKAFEARGLTVIPLEGGARFACDELERGGDAVEVVCEGPRPETGSVTRTITVAAHPYLTDHSIDGRPVVPVAMVLEWFADAARQVYPRSHVTSVDDLAVLKGIVLEDGAAELTLSWEPAPSAPGAPALAMQLASAGGSRPQIHYKAVVTLAHEAPVVHRFGGSNGLGKQPFTAETYGPWLFHGPAFQGIDEVVGYSDHGIVAWLKSSTPGALGLGGAEWTTDPLTVDSALQLMLLWVGETQGARALPCRIQRFQQFKPFTGRVACHLEMTKANARSGRFQATFVDEAGDIVAKLDAGEYAARS
jgi:NAD(P)-dependent dehydrogenase (short-subunit alcohol dehydrogenase family)/acyl carrier protein